MSHEETRAIFWPGIAHHLHIGPRDLDQLTVEEFDAAVEYVRQITKGG